MVNTWWSRRRLETPGCNLRAWISVNEWYWGWSQRMPWKGMESASKVGRKKWKWSNIGNASKCFSRDRKERRPKTAWCVISSCDGNLLYQVYLDLFTFMTKKLNTYTGKGLRTKALWPCQGGFISDVDHATNSFYHINYVFYRYFQSWEKL